MAQKRKPDQSQKIAEAALSLAEKSGWQSLTLDAVAKKARIPVKTVEAAFFDTWDILVWVLKKIETDTTAIVKKSLGKSWRDNLFDIMMTRADLAQKNKAAFKSVRKAVVLHPPAARHLLKPFYDAMRNMLDLAGLEKSKCSPIHLLAFSALYLSLVDVWMKDDSQDLSKTMAALDKRLGYFEKLLSYSP